MKRSGGTPARSGDWGIFPFAGRFVSLVWAEYHRHNIMGMASSLSYTTLLSLVPVFAILLGVIGLIREGMYTEMFISTLKNQIPAVSGMDNLVDAIRSVAGDAKAILGFGLLMFIGTGFFLFINVVKDFNRIWRVEKSRSIVARLSGFITAIILVPMLMVLSLYVNLYVARTVDTLDAAMARRPLAESSAKRDIQAETIDEDRSGTGGEEEVSPAEDSFPVSPGNLRYDSDNPDEVSREVESYRSGNTAVRISLLLTSLLLNILAMSTIYTLLPNRKVMWWAALSGGVFAGVILELGNYFFRLYAAMSSSVLLKIYGTLLAVPLGLLWLWILWIIVLLGAVVCYVSQHFSVLSEQADLEDRDRDNDLFIGLLLTIEAAERYHRGIGAGNLAEAVSVETGFSEVLVRDVLSRLVEKRVLVAVEGRNDEYIPARGITAITLDQIVFPILGELFNVSAARGYERNDRIIRILEGAGYALKSSLDRITLGELVFQEDGKIREAD